MLIGQKRKRKKNNGNRKSSNMYKTSDAQRK